MEDDLNRANLSFPNISKNFSEGDFQPVKCPGQEELFRNFYFAVPLTLLITGSIIILGIVGNILVILSVFTYRPLMIVQNFFIVSLAVADLAVATLVLPVKVAYILLGRWALGKILCTMWLTSDVMCCTASILSLCAIALDRYWAITDPINYAQKRTLRRVNMMVSLIWVLSAIICAPPLIGWNNWPKEFKSCQLTSQPGYVIYSALGSFYIPLMIMLITNIEIFVAMRRRLRERANASKLNVLISTADVQINSVKEEESLVDQEPVSSEPNHNENPSDTKQEKKNETNNTKRKAAEDNDKSVSPNYPVKDSVTNVLEEEKHNDESCTPPIETTTTTVESPASHTPSQKCVQIKTPLKEKTHIHDIIQERQKISLTKERRAAKILGIIMGVFVICWLPFFVIYVVPAFCEFCCVPISLTEFFTWLGYINSALNPIIYTMFNDDFRKAFKKILRIKTEK